MNKTILSLTAGFMLALGALGPGVSFADGPYLMVFGEDADQDAVPRNSRVFKRVLNGLRSQLDEKGFDVFDETAVSVKQTQEGEGGFAQNRVRRTDAEILDIAQSLKRPPIDVAVVFEVYASAQERGYTTKVNTRVSGHMLTVQSGKFLGDFEVSKSFNAPAQCNRECILEAVGAKARILSEELGDVLSIKLAHLVKDAPRDPLAEQEDGVKKGYSLVFNNFTADDRLDIEEYLVIFSGYQLHRPVDCSRLYCEYWYESTISGAKLNRNIKRMLEQLSIQANVSFEGSTIRVDKITLRADDNESGGRW